MREIRLSATAGAPPPRVFELLADVPGYPDVIDNCTAARVLSEADNDIDTELTLRQGLSEDTYHVRVRLEPPGGVTMNFDGDAPLRLDIQWQFAAQGEERCRIDMTARYKASSRSKEFFFKPLVQRMCSQLLDAVVAAAAKRA